MTPSTKGGSTSLQLPCPACHHELSIAPRSVSDGFAVRCLECGAESMLSHEWDERSDSYHWELVDAEAERGDERR
jgi:ribosomal protein S27E